MSATRAVIAGGGPAAMEAALALRRSLEPGSEIVLVAPEEEFVYRPLAVAEPFGAGETWSHPLEQLASLAGAVHLRDGLAHVDAEKREIGLDSGDALSYDALLVAVGARPVEAIPGAITFRGRGGDPDFRDALERLRSLGGQIVFKVPHRVRWTLPLYEVAMLAAQDLDRTAGRDVTISIVTPEVEPLAIIGGDASRELVARLEELRVRVHVSADPLSRHPLAEPSETAGERVVVALPHWVGPGIEGLPSNDEGFLITDEHQRVIDVPRVYAAGDVTDHDIKQGGFATEQAAAAATTIAADLGFVSRPGSVEPVLRARLYTRGRPLFMRGRIEDAHRHPAVVEEAPLWWPGAKLYGRNLAPFLAEIALADELTGETAAPR